MRKALTFDDVGIIPKYSEILSRNDISLTTRFTKSTILKIPVVSSPMDTVTGYAMALEMMEWGGVGVLHRFNTIEEQSFMMKQLHREWESFFKIDGMDRTLEDTWEQWRNSYSIGNPPTKEDWDDLKEEFWFTDETIKMNKEWLMKPLCAAIGVVDDYLERAQELVNNGCNVLLIDVAHGHHKLVKDAIRELKNGIKGNVEIIGGNIATAEAAKDLCEWGFDGLRCGVGGGCFTPEMEVLTDIGLKRISDIEINDMVYTHTGELNPVINKFEFDKDEEIMEINNIECTKNHEFYVIHKKYKNTVNEDNIEDYAVWICANKLTDDYLLINVS